MAIQRSPAERLASLLGAHMHDPKLGREYLSTLGFELPAEGWDPEKEDFPEHLFLEWLEADPTGDRSQTAVAVARKLRVAPEEMDPVWRLFCRDLDRCTRGRLTDIDFRSIRAWAARSARFSFAIKLREQWTDPKRPPEERPS